MKITKRLEEEIQLKIQSIKKDKKSKIDSIAKDIVRRTKFLNKNPEQKIKQIHKIRDQICKDVDLENNPDILSIGREFCLKMIEFSTFDIEGLYDNLYSRLVNIKNIKVIIYACNVDNYNEFMNSYKNGHNPIKIMLPTLSMEYLRGGGFNPCEIYNWGIIESVHLIDRIEPHREQIISKYNEILEKMKLSNQNPILYNEFMSIVNYYQIFYYTYIRDEIFNGEIDDFIDFVINTPNLLGNIGSNFLQHKFDKAYSHDFTGNLWYHKRELPSRFNESIKTFFTVDKNVLKIIYNALYFTRNNNVMLE